MRKKYDSRLRRTVVAVGHWVMSRRYAVWKAGFEVFQSSDVSYLILPNHAAMVDPMLLFSEFREQPVSPLCDELYFSNPFAAAFLKVFDAIKVPDLRRRRAKSDIKVVCGLQDVVLRAFEARKSILFYPSGHIATGPREEIGTRQQAHNVCRWLPKGVRVIGVRTTGLWGSIWSRRRCRTVDMAFEDLTERVCTWANLPRQEFNHRLEEWYNA